MPLYEYQCRPHGHRFEVRHGITESPELTCPECSSGDVRRVIHPVGIVFKGSGFYATDSRTGNPASKPAENKDDTSKSDSTSTETKSAEAKSDKKSDSSGEAKAS